MPGILLKSRSFSVTIVRMACSSIQAAMSRGSPLIKFLTFFVKQLANPRSLAQKLDLLSGYLLVSRSVQGLNLHQRLTLIRQIRPLLQDNRISFDNSPIHFHGGFLLAVPRILSQKAISKDSKLDLAKGNGSEIG